ncbi:MAG: sugar-binding transcriptional regulator [Armatimonadota bacterium]
MSTTNPGSTPAPPDLEILVRVATLYHMEDRTQEEIAAVMGISRVKVGRLLRRARGEGVVEIRVHAHPEVDVALESAIARHHGLRSVVLVDGGPTEETARERVGAAAAAHLARLLRTGSTVAVGMGRNVGAVADHAAETNPRELRFVSAIGGSAQIGPNVNAAEICRRLATRFGGTGEVLYAPAYADTTAQRDALLGHDDVRTALDNARSAAVALVGVGDVGSESHVVRLGCVSEPDMGRLLAAGAVGDILGVFFDRDGNTIEDGVQDRVIGLSEADLRAIPCLVAVASESTKGEAVLGALRSGLVDVLVATTAIGRQVESAR